jgi:dTDP-D-glucose 4,6-dehydratase
VTGGAGFLGSHFVRTMLAGGYPGFDRASITVLDKLTYAGNLENLRAFAGHRRLVFVQGDICDAALLARLVPGHSFVVNFAAETHVDRSITGPSAFVSTNVTGVHVLAQACLDARIRRPRSARIPRTPRARPVVISSPSPMHGRTGSTCASPGAAIPTARTSTPRKLFRSL